MGADITTCVTVTVSKIAESQIVMKLLGVWNSGLLLLLLVKAMDGDSLIVENVAQLAVGLI